MWFKRRRGRKRMVLLVAIGVRVDGGFESWTGKVRLRRVLLPTRGFSLAFTSGGWRRWS